ncbi:hypothetical protein K8T06_10260 [bacterium]|nr:hypothetical protein [bacterium]
MKITEVTMQSSKTEDGRLRYPFVEALIDEGRLVEVRNQIDSISILLKTVSVSETNSEIVKRTAEVVSGLCVTADLLARLSEITDRPEVSIN